MKRNKLILALIMVLFCSVFAKAQSLYELEIIEKDGVWQPITGGIQLTTGDDNVAQFNLPFTFYFDNQPFTFGSANCNGFIALGRIQGGITVAAGNSTTGYNVIAWNNCDLIVNGGVHYLVTGTAPKRIAIIQWNDVSYFSNNVPRMWGQIRLHETTNRIEIVFGPQSGQVGWRAGRASITGKKITPLCQYINIKPGIPSTFYFGNNTTQWLTTAIYPLYCNEGKTYVYGKSDPKLLGTYPAGGEVLRKGLMYGGSSDLEKHPAMFIKREAGLANVLLSYRIFGPGAENEFGSKVIYRAKDPMTGTFEVNPGNIIGDSARYDFIAGTGVCFGTQGILDLQTNSSAFSPGEYTVKSSMMIEDVGVVETEPVTFNIALPFDIGISKILKPKAKTEKKYPLAPTPISLRVTNTGLNSITHFLAEVEIFDANGNKVGNTLSQEWINVVDSLKSAEYVDLNNLGWFNPEFVGVYKLKSHVTLLDVSDQYPDNNYYSRISAADYEFVIAKEVDLRAVKIVFPTMNDKLVAGRPFYPIARFTNQGINDVDNDTVFFEITYIQTGELVFKDKVINHVITAGARFDTTDVKSVKNFVPPYLGTYNICATIYSNYDDNPLSMRKVCGTFEVSDGLVGNYTIGIGTGNRNFPTIQEAVDALYQYGVGGNVVFELTDKGPYAVGNINDLDNPALDLTGFISGMSSNATVTFKPSESRAVERGGDNSGVTIQVLTGSGIGILMGQNDLPFNSYAIIHSVPPSQKNKYSFSNGYFIFDGGQNKSIRFVLKTDQIQPVYFHNVFYLRQGSSNISIKNCLFENVYKDAGGNNKLLHTYLPKVNSQGTQVTFMDDKFLPNTSYSAAIVLRAVSPTSKGGTNMYSLDTLVCSNNIIESNDISGFGYGVVDMGDGALLREQHNLWTKYYNKNNTIKNNIIHDVARAGIYLGFTDGEKVSGNRIYNVSGNYFMYNTNDAGGIMAGGDKEGGWYGFNNVNLTISGNEISNVNSTNIAYGIKVEQVRNKYGQDSWFPDVKEKTDIMNNLVWGMNSSGLSQSRVGIRLFTERTETSNFLEAMFPDYFTSDDRILSNTVIIPDDAGATAGALAGIAVQHSKSTRILNNAVAIEDDLIDENSPASALIFFEGIKSGETGGLESNRNAFWRNNPEDVNGPAVFGWVELNSKGEFIEPINPDAYQPNDYETIRQWRNWTGQDMNSVFGDFTKDLAETGSTVKYLKVKNPRPKGSVLNDRGYRLDEYLTDNMSGLDLDAFGSERGVNGQLFDIGAQEFEGGLFLNDVEFVMISSPAAYKSGAGTNSDAEHIMTTLPVKFKAIVRNSGSLFQSGTKIRLEVTDLDVNTQLHYYDTVEADIVVTQSKEVVFNLPDTLIKTYTDLEEKGFNPVVPSRFNPWMKPNVTPRYKFKIEVQADENNSNNLGETTLRFYLRKADKTSMLIAGEFVNVDLENIHDPEITEDEVAGKLNFLALEQAFEKIGWYPGLKRDIDNQGSDLDSSKIDVFDRLAWEPKSVYYRMYKYLFWADRNDIDNSDVLNQISREQQWDIEEFLGAGETKSKKNLVIASQEAVRNIDFPISNPNYDDKSTKFVNEQLRAKYLGNGYAFGIGTNCHNKLMNGVAVEREIIETIKQTGMSFQYANGTEEVFDVEPQVGLVDIFLQGDGLARTSFEYKADADLVDEGNRSGIASTTLRKNVIYIGVDWRHMANTESVLRAVIDYYDKNDPDIPVELVKFEAKDVINRVDLSWETASEFNTDRFEVEKALVIDDAKGSFDKVTEVRAAGTSNSTREYVASDKNVDFGGVYVYRLKMVDFDGSFDYSDEKLVEIGGAGAWLGEASPNPAVENAEFILKTAGGDIELYIMDISGRKFNPNYTYANSKLDLNLSNVSSGVYTLVVKAGELTMTRQFGVVR